MTGVNEDAYWDLVQARKEHWADEDKGPVCEKCGCSLNGFYKYDTPEGLLCENCAFDLAMGYMKEWEVA